LLEESLKKLENNSELKNIKDEDLAYDSNGNRILI
jgi:hypothetical protein